MSALFRNLPPESVQQSSQETAEAAAPPNKRAKLTPVDADNVPVTKLHLAGQDPVSAALIKITAHISSSRKFTKASELLRQLIVDKKIGEEHSKLVFEVCTLFSWPFLPLPVRGVMQPYCRHAWL